MNNNALSRDMFHLIGQQSSADCYIRPASEIYNGALRLEAGFYGLDGYRALRALKHSGFQLNNLGDYADIKWFGPFARTYVDDPSTGTPFLTSSEMLNFKLSPKYISNALTKNLNRLLVHKDTILISCSGSIGHIALCTDEYDGFALSQDAIRVVPMDGENIGVIYSFLLSSLGQFLLTQGKSGSVIEHIYGDDVSSLTLPLLPKKLRQKLTRLIKKTCNLRVQANALLDKAQQELKQSCNLPDLSDLKTDNVLENDSGATTFSWPLSRRFNLSGKFGTLRLDATYHEPKACLLEDYILQDKKGHLLEDVVTSVYRSNLRKRIYVADEATGVSMIGGKQLIQQRCSDIKYLSKVLTRGSSTEKVKSGWTLVTCGGTLGRIQFVHRNFENWSVSEDVMRIIPNSEMIFPGYLFSYLASPYGQIQIVRQGYGSVIPRLRDFQLNTVAICIPDDRGESIHNKVIEAFDARADARLAEDKAIELFMSAILVGREETESTWGKEYE